MEPTSQKQGRLRIAFRWCRRSVALCLILAILACLFVFRSAIYHRFVTFPKEAAAWESLRAQSAAPELDDGWNEYRGVCHSHSEISHDSTVPFEEILRVLKETDRDFIFIADHCVDGKADYSWQWKGLKDGKLFVPGFEMDYGFMPWGLPPEVVLDRGKEPAALAEEIASHGGLLFFAHTEEDRAWDLPQLTGMEIYNIHTDFKDENFGKLLPDFLLNLGAYPDQVFRLLFDRQTDILANWDRLNLDRDITGIAANDCHQNNGFHGVYREGDTLEIWENSGDLRKTFELNPVTRTLLGWTCGPLEADREVFRYVADPYERMVRFVSTHVLARELTEASLLEGLEEGRAFVAFDMIADSDGFVFLAESAVAKAVMGESIAYGADVTLRAAAPLPCRFTVLRHGDIVHRAEGRSLAWQPAESGKYRIEAELDILGQWTPWIYSNPVTLT